MPPKKLVRKYRAGRKKLRVRRKTIIHATPRMIYDIQLNSQALTFTVGAANWNSYTFSPSLSNVAGNDLTAFQNLYDEFKITGFTWMLKARGNIAFGSIGPQGFQYYSVLDYSDSNTLANVNEALEYRNVRYHKSFRDAKRYVPCMCPQLIRDVNNNPLLVVVKPRWMQLTPQVIGGLNYDDTLVAMLGCKIITETNNNANPVTFDLYVKLHVQFRNKK